MCRSAANIIKVEGTIITFEGGDRADFGQVAEGCVCRAEADVTFCGSRTSNRVL